MKSLLKLVIITLIVAPVVFLGLRYSKNHNSAIPYPYFFKANSYSNIQVDAPILIIGDRLGKRLASFSKFMSQRISDKLSKPIQVVSIATDGEGIHRTLEKIKSLGKLPLITIYLGGSEEFNEQLFLTKDTKDILFNFKLYEDDRIKTLLMIFPILSRFLYNNIHYRKLSSEVNKDNNNYSDSITQKRNIIQFKIYEQKLNELFSYLKEHNSYLIAITQPLNIDISPMKNCSGSIELLAQEKLKEVKAFIKDKDFKSAYNISKDLTLIASSSATIHFIHGKIAKSLGYHKEALKSLELAMAYDCKSWRGDPVYNVILKNVARRNDVLIFDFQNMLKDYWTKNILFEDEIYPQGYYYEKMVEVLAQKIKKLLKL